MKTGWVIAAPFGTGWTFRIVAPSGEVERREAAAPSEALTLLADGMRIGLVCGLEGAPRAELPCAPADVLRDLPVDGRWRIVPRFSQDKPIMLSGGEEVMLAGAISIAPNFDGCILIRGRERSLWAQISAGEVVSMLGSAFPALRHDFAPGPVAAGKHDTAEAAADTLSRPERLGQHLASIPALRQMRGLDNAGIGARVAGWLFGAELAAAKPWWLGQPVLLISDQEDGAAGILEAQGISLHHLPPDAALLAGLKAIAPL